MAENTKMNLKQAFHYQNKLREWLQEATQMLSFPQNLVTNKRKLLFSKVDNTLQDKEEDGPGKLIMLQDETPEQCMDFAIFLLDEIKEITRAIRKTKDYRAYGEEDHVDDAVYINKLRRGIMSVITDKILSVRDEQHVRVHGGTGYRFNAEGNEVSFRCDLIETSTVNYDRQKMISLLSTLQSKADKVTNYVEKAMITCEVDYDPPIDESLDFHDALQTFLTME